MFLPLVIPADVTQCLLEYSEPADDWYILTTDILAKIKQEKSGFVQRLVEWMRPLCPTPPDELKALNDLFASIKVTHKLLKENRSFGKSLPRSTFVCPAYVGDDEVGGIAFACSGFVSRTTALIGELITATILNYLRLREDALAHNIAQEMGIVDQTKQLLLHRVVHDLRHPADALQSAIFEQESMLKSIKEQLNHLTTALDETLISLYSSDRQQFLSGKAIRVRKNKDSVAEFMADVAFLFHKRFEQMDKCLEVVQIPADWDFRVDSGLMREILDNLLSNALEHAMKKGGKKVQINVEKQNRKYVFHIRDDGPGIPEKDWENIFRPFYRMSHPSKGEQVRGQGLAIARILARAHGGNLELVPSVAPWKIDFLLTVPF